MLLGGGNTRRKILHIHRLLSPAIETHAFSMGLPLTTARKLQLVEATTARQLTSDYFRPLMSPHQFHWVLGQFQSKFKVMAISIKPYMVQAIWRIVCPHKSSHGFKIFEEAILLVPSPSHICLVGTQEREPLVVAPKLWNPISWKPACPSITRQKTFSLAKILGTHLASWENFEEGMLCSDFLL